MYFLDKKCNVYQKTIVDTNGEQVNGFSTVYTNISCDFYQEQKNKYTNNNFVVYSDTNKFYVVLEADKTLVRQGQIIELIDNTIGSYTKYLIETVEVFRNHTGIINNIYLSVSKYNG